MATKDEVLAEIEQYKKTLGGAYCASESAVEKLTGLCDLIDSLADEFDAEEVSYIVDPKIRHGYVCMESVDIVLSHGRSHYFFEGVRDADFVGFDKAKSGNLRLSLGVKDLWVVQ